MELGVWIGVGSQRRTVWQSIGVWPPPLTGTSRRKIQYFNARYSFFPDRSVILVKVLVWDLSGTHVRVQSHVGGTERRAVVGGDWEAGGVHGWLAGSRGEPHHLPRGHRTRRLRLHQQRWSPPDAAPTHSRLEAQTRSVSSLWIKFSKLFCISFAPEVGIGSERQKVTNYCYEWHYEGHNDLSQWIMNPFTRLHSPETWVQLNEQH